MVFSSVHTGAPANAGDTRIRGRRRRAPAPARYQLDLMTPGNLPMEAMFRKQIRQTPNFRR